MRIKHNRLKIAAIFAGLLAVSLNMAAQSYSEWIDKSYDFLEKNDLAAAEMCLESAMRQEPGNPVNYALLGNLGTIQRRQGKYEEALMSYTTALGRKPSDVTLLENRASLYAQLSEVDKAIGDYTVLLMAQPENQDALYCRGLLYLQQRDFLKAEDDFEKILDISKESLQGQVGHAILEKMRGNYDDSEQLYNYLIGRMPNQWSLYEGRADLYFLMGRNGRAMADINKLFVETTPTAALYVLRGKVKLAQYEKTSAIADFQKALEMGYDSIVIGELMKMAK